MAILEDRQLDASYYISNLYISVMVAQRIRFTTPRFIRVEGQDLIKFLLKKRTMFSGNIPDTLRKRVPQTTCSPGKRAISSIPCSTSNGESWHIILASISAIHFKCQSIFLRNGQFRVKSPNFPADPIQISTKLHRNV